MTASAPAGMRPRLRRSVDPRITADGRIFILRGPDHPDLTLEADPRLMGLLLRALDGSRTVGELADHLAGCGVEVDAAELRAALCQLRDAGVVDDVSGDERFLSGREADRYQRQLAYFADLGGGLPAATQRRLLDSTACLLGLGGIGSWIAWALAGAGVGSMTGVDRDRLELSNLNRQVLFREEDLGAWKSDAAGSALRAFNGDLRYRGVRSELDGPASVEAVIDGADIVVSTLDWPPHLIGRWVNEACFRRGIPHITASQHPPHVRSGPLYLPGVTGCLACQEQAYRERYPLYAELEAADQPQAPSATLGSACGVVGTLAANDVIAHLGELHAPSTLGRAFQLDLRTFEGTFEPVERRPGCPICS